jgi:DNA-binding MltR family transcriptional regulator
LLRGKSYGGGTGNDLLGTLLHPLDYNSTMYELEDPNEEAAFYEQGSDRAVAVVCTAIVENRLTDLIAAAMRDDTEVFKELFRASGPLGSLASKIRLAYLMRLLHGDIYRDLLIVTKIRNDFAHSVKITSFDDPSAKSRVEGLHATAVYRSLGEKLAADLQSHPDESGIRVREQIVRFDLLSTRDTFKASLSFYIWKLVTSAKGVREWIRSQPEPTPERT